MSPRACPASAVVAVWPTGLRLSACSCWTKHNLGPGHFFWMFRNPSFLRRQALLLCSFFHGLMVEDSLFPPRPAPSPAPLPGDPVGLAVMAGADPAWPWPRAILLALASSSPQG